MPGGVSSGWPQSVSCITYAYTHCIFCVRLLQWVSALAGHSLCPALHMHTHIAFLCVRLLKWVSALAGHSLCPALHMHTHTALFCVRLLKWVSALAGHSLCPALHITYAYTHSIVLCQAFSVGVSSGWTVKRVCVEVFSFEHSYRIQLRISGANLASLCMQQQHANVACIDFKLGCVVE